MLNKITSAIAVAALTLATMFAMALPAQANGAPTVVSAVLAGDGLTINLTFSEPMAAAASPSGFVPKLLLQDTNYSILPNTVGTIADGGTQLILSLLSPIAGGAPLLLDFTNAGTVIAKTDEAPVANFTGMTITNNSTYTGGGGQMVQGTLVSMPSFVINSSAIESYVAGVWDGGETYNDIAVCDDPKSKLEVPADSGNDVTAGCRPLWGGMSGGETPTNLASAYTFPPSGGSMDRVKYDPSLHGENVLIFSFNGGKVVHTASISYLGGGDAEVSPDAENTYVAPYTGPILTAPASGKPAVGGSKLILDGSNLSGVSKVEIAGKDATVKVLANGQIEITVPTGLEAGVYDIVVTSEFGKLTIQDGLRVAAGASTPESSAGAALPATKLKPDNSVKVYISDVAGAGKVQIYFNGKEVAWVNASDPSDPKLKNGYLVRTLNLVDGKNVIEVYVDGVRVDRKAYTKTI